MTCAYSNYLKYFLRPFMSVLLLLLRFTGDKPVENEWINTFLNISQYRKQKEHVFTSLKRAHELGYYLYCNIGLS